MGSRLDACFTVGAIIILVLVCNSVKLEGKRIIVGDDQHWQFGFNYTNWALNASPFHQKDKLVFMYDAPNNTTHAHSVYLLKDLKSFVACDLKKAKEIGNPLQGGGHGLEYVLKSRMPHYFACGEKGGFHCQFGLMKFAVIPARRCQCSP